jgi:hypothetical protein
MVAIGVVGFALAIVALVFMLLGAQSLQVSRLYLSDIERGELVRAPTEYWWSAGHQAWSLQYERLLPLTGLALGFASLVLVGLWRMKERRERWRIAAPIGVPLLAALALGALTDLRLDWVLSKAYIAPWLEWPVPGSHWPEPRDPITAYCGRVIALDSVWSAATLLILGSTLALAIPAGRAAWRAGKRGHRLGEGWSAAALGCFTLGVLALLMTRPHAQDRASTIASCDARQSCGDSEWGWPLHLENPTSHDIHALRAPDCDPRHCTAHAQALPNTAESVGAYQLFATGTIALLPRYWQQTVEESLEDIDTDPQQFRIRLADEVRKTRELGAWRGETLTPVLLLYADVRTRAEVFGAYLEVMRDAGVEEILVLGENTITGELASVGPWRYRIACPVGRIRFDDANRRLDEFATWAELGAAAASLGFEPLRLAL